MIRLFKTNAIRAVTELEGMWDFYPHDVGDDKDNRDGGQEAMSLYVPGSWETHPKLLSYRGIGTYKKTIELEQQSHLRLVFKGVSHTAVVYFDGVQIAHHYNAYTAFSAVVKDASPGTHELKVVVDNSFNAYSSLHIPNDYYTYGGLIRPVALEIVPDVWIERLECCPFLVEGVWHAEVKSIVKNIDVKPHQVRLEGECDGLRFEAGSGVVEPGTEAVLTCTQPFPDVISWSDGSPNLYLLGVKLFADGESAPTDDLIERIGFRVVTTENGRIQLDGQDVVLKGFNRHEDHPTAGASLPVSFMAHDLDLVADMGGNCVRTSHYPNDERFLDLCDERGIMVWEENHARGLNLDNMRHPNFIAQCEAVNREMVEQHVNHPSILMWGILNECASDSEEGRIHYERQIAQIRALDSSRPITFASHHRSRELCFDLADIVSVNLYPGWYTDEDPGELFDQVKVWADTRGGAGKPIIISEFGGDGYYGLRDPNRVRGTEERQADILEAILKACIERPFISGALIWQFCDCRVVEGTGWLLSRAGTQNSKGIVDRYRRPKLAYQVVQTYFRKEWH